MKKYVYFFGEGDKSMKETLGGKGANLSEMTKIGIPVPPGFTISAEVCDYFYKHDKRYPDELKKQIDENLAKLEAKMGAKLGDSENPLLVSVRSGAAISMPGMMDTVLNLGLNDESVQGLIKKTGNERFTWDAYRRFINMFGDVVMGVDHHHFEEQLDSVKKTKGVEYDTDLDAGDLKKVVELYKEVVRKHTGKLFPSDPREQLQMAIDAVFGSWNNPRAISYRRINEIKGLLGTAVNVQTMVFGNMGDSSGTGVFFTRDPSTGENKFYGEFLINAQGEDVVAGIRTPQPITELKKIQPENYNKLIEIYKKCEKHYKDMQDMEFTIQEAKLYILQTRNGKRTAAAAVRIAVEMVAEGLIDKKTAVLRVEPNQLDQLLHKQLDPVAKKEAEVIAKGLPASPGAAVGEVVFDAHTAFNWAQEGKKVILVRIETSPEDIEGMNAAQGILTARGGMTSHAAVVARGMGKCCVAGCGDISISYKEKQFSIGNLIIKEGDYITLDGGTGELFKGKIPTVDPELSGNFGILMEWADSFRKIGVRANADIPRDAKVAVKFGAEGIGLCRTEHMFFEGERIKHMRKMILAETVESRKAALDKLLPYQKSDFKGLFEAMGEYPVIIRLLDPPLHEFLPHKEDEIKEISIETGVSVQKIKEKIASLHEFNPMLGHRGCRLGIAYPEITEMQARAIVEGAYEVAKKTGKKVKAKIMIPLVGKVGELSHQKKIVEKVIEEAKGKYDKELPFSIGTMIEVPRGALTADEVAKEAEFFSFGTNDLTQMTCGFSRDDAGKFLKQYVELGIYEKDPFQAIDQTGVGEMMKIAIKKGRKTRPDLEIGICGEHGGEPSSVEFCHRIGLNYVSCSPYRVPIARLAAAHAALKEE
ncbi:pyruvate, phosphate dikinase [Candidatus Woesearchaeota archaeon]|nr:pyruvate, phosphate dikinase [Candidatus Woesearchaeota archaeon]